MSCCFGRVCWSAWTCAERKGDRCVLCYCSKVLNIKRVQWFLLFCLICRSWSVLSPQTFFVLPSCLFTIDSIQVAACTLLLLLFDLIVWRCLSLLLSCPNICVTHSRCSCDSYCFSCWLTEAFNFWKMTVKGITECACALQTLFIRWLSWHFSFLSVPKIKPGKDSLICCCCICFQSCFRCFWCSEQLTVLLFIDYFPNSTQCLNVICLTCFSMLWVISSLLCIIAAKAQTNCKCNMK